MHCRHSLSDDVLGLMIAALLSVIQPAVCPRPARLGRGADPQESDRHISAEGTGPR